MFNRNHKNYRIGIRRSIKKERGIEWVALREDDGQAYLLQNIPGEVKVKGLGRFDVSELLDGYKIGDRILVGHKSFIIAKAAFA